VILFVSYCKKDNKIGRTRVLNIEPIESSGNQEHHQSMASTKTAHDYKVQPTVDVARHHNRQKY
jgi:hypothetical protein